MGGNASAFPFTSLRNAQTRVTAWTTSTKPNYARYAMNEAVVSLAAPLRGVFDVYHPTLQLRSAHSPSSSNGGDPARLHPRAVSPSLPEYGRLPPAKTENFVPGRRHSLRLSNTVAETFCTSTIWTKVKPAWYTTGSLPSRVPHKWSSARAPWMPRISYMWARARSTKNSCFFCGPLH